MRTPRTHSRSIFAAHHRRWQSIFQRCGRSLGRRTRKTGLSTNSNNDNNNYNTNDDHNWLTPLFFVFCLFFRLLECFLVVCLLLVFMCGRPQTISRSMQVCWCLLLGLSVLLFGTSMILSSNPSLAPICLFLCSLLSLLFLLLSLSFSLLALSHAFLLLSFTLPFILAYVHTTPTHPTHAHHARTP